MEGKNFYAGYLKAMSYMEKPNVICRSLDCLDFECNEEIEKSIKNYLASRYYEFGMPPSEWEKYPDESYKKVIEKTKLHLEKVENWKSGLQKFLEHSLPKVYGHRIDDDSGEIIEINVLGNYFIETLKDEIHEISMLDEYEDVDKNDLVKAYKFENKDYDFLKHCFAWTLLDTFIIVIGSKGYMMYFGYND